MNAMFHVVMGTTHAMIFKAIINAEINGRCLDMPMAVGTFAMSP